MIEYLKIRIRVTKGFNIKYQTSFNKILIKITNNNINKIKDKIIKVQTSIKTTKTKPEVQFNQFMNKFRLQLFP